MSKVENSDFRWKQKQNRACVSIKLAIVWGGKKRWQVYLFWNCQNYKISFMTKILNVPHLKYCSTGSIVPQEVPHHTVWLVSCHTPQTVSHTHSDPHPTWLMQKLNWLFQGHPISKDRADVWVGLQKAIFLLHKKISYAIPYCLLKTEWSLAKKAFCKEVIWKN